MKNNLFFLTILFSVFIFNHLQAQTAEDEAGIKALTQNLESAYNEENIDALKNMYLEDAVRIGTDKQQIKGAAQIAEFFGKRFREANTTLKLNHKSITWSSHEHAFMAEGTYEMKGATVDNTKIQNTGSYTLFVLKENGKWKIARSIIQ